MTTWLALVRLFWSIALTRVRVAILSLLGLVAVGLGVVVGQSDPTSSAAQAAASLIDTYGFTLLAPIVTLVIASACFDNLVEDSTLVYLWLRPIPRWYLASAAAAASVSAAAPIVGVPLVVAALVSGGGGAVVAGTIVGSVVAALGYAGFFVAAGLVTRRSLTWGMVYVLVWEAFIARVGTTSSRLSVQHYARSVMAEVANVTLEGGDASLWLALATPVVFLVIGVALTSHWLRRTSVA